MATIPSLDELLRQLSRLAEGRPASGVAFDIPDDGFDHLSKLLKEISKTIAETDNTPIPFEALSDAELQQAAEATNSAASAANAAAEAADTAAHAASLGRKEGVARRAVYTALKAAAAAYRAAGASREAAIAAETMPPGAQLLFDPEVRIAETHCRLFKSWPLTPS